MGNVPERARETKLRGTGSRESQDHRVLALEKAQTAECCRQRSLIAKQRQLSPDLKGLKKIASCKKYAIFSIFLHSYVYWRKYKKWRSTIKNAWHSWFVLYVSILTCQMPFFIGLFKFWNVCHLDSNVCWLHCEQNWYLPQILQGLGV